MKNLSTANRLLLLQGIDLIQGGLKLIEWLDDYPNETTRDSLTILRDRFAFFVECTLEEARTDLLIIDKIKEDLNKVNWAFDEKQEVKEKLKKLRVKSYREQLNVNEMERKELIEEIREDVKKELLSQK